MFEMPDPKDWYWRRDNGGIYSSAAQAKITKDDPDYQAWLAAGRLPTRWPEDDEGSQTDDALDEVLRVHGLTFSGEPVPPAPPITYKADIYRRCTNPEAEAIDAALAAAPIRERRLFECAQYLDHSAPEFATMRAAMTEMFGEARANVLLAASA